MQGELVVHVLGLQRECVTVQPVEQLHVQAEADVWELRSMNVTVDESWDQELITGQGNCFGGRWIDCQLLSSVLGVTASCGDLQTQ